MRSPSSVRRTPMIKKRPSPTDSEMTKSEKRILNNSESTEKPPFMERDGSETITSPKRAKCSENNEWIPSGLMQNSCYDRFTGELLSKEQCVENIGKALKSSKNMDFYEVLRLAEHHEIKNTPMQEIAQTAAFVIFKLNKMEKKVKDDHYQPDGSGKQESRIFDLDKAREIDTETFLPGGKRILISALLSDGLMSRCVGRNQTKALEKSIITILDEIYVRDDWFLLYSVPESSRSTCFLKIEPSFFDVFGKILKAGFDIPDSTWTLQKVVAQVKSATRNYIYKRRSKVQNIEGHLESFKSMEENDPVFRSTECFIHEQVPLSHYASISSSRRSTPDSEETPVVSADSISVENTVVVE